MKAEDVVAVIEAFAAKSRALADEARVDGARIVAAKVWRNQAPDPEARDVLTHLTAHDLLCFIAEEVKARIARDHEISGADTKPELMHVSFVTGDE